MNPRFTRHMAIVFATGVLVSGCALDSRRSGVTANQALTVARGELKNRLPDRFEHFEATLGDDPEFGRWNIFFWPQGEFADPGAYLLIRVYKSDGRVEVEHGR